MINEHLVESIQASVEAGYAILDVYHSNFKVEYKDDNTPLTLADKQAHEIIAEHLIKFNIPILSEEGKHISYKKRKTWDRLWIVDPLDGTKEFIKRNGEFTVNIALIQNKRPVLGVVYLPDKKKLFFAGEDIGSYKLENGKIIESLSRKLIEDKKELLDKIINRSVKLPLSRRPASQFTIVGSRSHVTPEQESFVEKKRQEHGDLKFISAGSSNKFCIVAEGKADMYPRLGPTMEWDTAAGQAVAENAGCKVLCFDTNRPLTYNKENLLNPWFIVTHSG